MSKELMMMHVGCVVHTFYPNTVGDPFNAYQSSLRQSRSGHRVTVFTWNRNGHSLSEHVNDCFTIKRLRGLNLALSPSLTEYPFLPTLEQEIGRSEVDIIHAHSIPFLTTYCAVKTARMLRMPSVLTVHGVSAPRDPVTNLFQSAIRHSLSCQVLRNSTFVICLTRHDAKEVMRIGCPSEKIRMIPNAIDTELFSPAPEAENDNLIVWVGRFVPEKGVPCLIEAAKNALSNKSNITFLLVGEGPEKWKLVRLVRSLHLEEKVIFAGALGRRDVADVLRKATMFVFPSLSEGLPIALLEAMSTGKPVVASGIPGIKEVIENGLNGILVPPGDSDTFARAILELLEDDQARRTLGRNARETVTRRFVWTKVLSAIDSVYEEAMKAASR